MRSANHRRRFSKRKKGGRWGAPKRLTLLCTCVQRKSAPPLLESKKGGKAGGSKKAVVAGWIDQCTFKPQLNPKSLEVMLFTHTHTHTQNYMCNIHTHMHNVDDKEQERRSRLRIQNDEPTQKSRQQTQGKKIKNRDTN